MAQVLWSDHRACEEAPGVSAAATYAAITPDVAGTWSRSDFGGGNHGVEVLPVWPAPAHAPTASAWTWSASSRRARPDREGHLRRGGARGWHRSRCRDPASASTIAAVVSAVKSGVLGDSRGKR